eukprot:TRINITY_DN21775_c0_g1_i1.p1 TRINITY_DN21775_c0_g1~~TRINITY_DN21775_c0_g1_i1.p1  ORF type:complete len:694 (+),score=99.47 TRINITY_DN21775_c0_g1_i1:77-2158(+)
MVFVPAASPEVAVTRPIDWQVWETVGQPSNKQRSAWADVDAIPASLPFSAMAASEKLRGPDEQPYLCASVLAAGGRLPGARRGPPSIAVEDPPDRLISKWSSHTQGRRASKLLYGGMERQVTEEDCRRASISAVGAGWDGRPPTVEEKKTPLKAELGSSVRLLCVEDLADLASSQQIGDDFRSWHALSGEDRLDAVERRLAERRQQAAKAACSKLSRARPKACAHLSLDLREEASKCVRPSSQGAVASRQMATDRQRRRQLRRGPGVAGSHGPRADTASALTLAPAKKSPACEKNAMDRLLKADAAVAEFIVHLLDSYGTIANAFAQLDLDCRGLVSEAEFTSALQFPRHGAGAVCSTTAVDIHVQALFIKLKNSTGLDVPLDATCMRSLLNSTNDFLLKRLEGFLRDAAQHFACDWSEARSQGDALDYSLAGMFPAGGIDCRQFSAALSQLGYGDWHSRDVFAKLNAEKSGQLRLQTLEALLEGFPTIGTGMPYRVPEPPSPGYSCVASSPKLGSAGRNHGTSAPNSLCSSPASTSRLKRNRPQVMLSLRLPIGSAQDEETIFSESLCRDGDNDRLATVRRGLSVMRGSRSRSSSTTSSMANSASRAAERPRKKHDPPNTHAPEPRSIVARSYPESLLTTFAVDQSPAEHKQRASQGIDLTLGLNRCKNISRLLPPESSSRSRGQSQVVFAD